MRTLDELARDVMQIARRVSNDPFEGAIWNELEERYEESDDSLRARVKVLLDATKNNAVK